MECSTLQSTSDRPCGLRCNHPINGRPRFPAPPPFPSVGSAKPDSWLSRPPCEGSPFAQAALAFSLPLAAPSASRLLNSASIISITRSSLIALELHERRSKYRSIFWRTLVGDRGIDIVGRDLRPLRTAGHKRRPPPRHRHLSPVGGFDASPSNISTSRLARESRATAWTHDSCSRTIARRCCPAREILGCCCWRRCTRIHRRVPQPREDSSASSSTISQQFATQYDITLRAADPLIAVVLVSASLRPPSDRRHDGPQED
jgi:hypothetical protein